MLIKKVRNQMVCVNGISTVILVPRGIWKKIKQTKYCSLTECLLYYCNSSIEVVNIIQEDHSAKDFDRPGWTAIMSYFKRYGSLCLDLLLFTKWDCFVDNKQPENGKDNNEDSYTISREEWFAR